MEINKVKGYIYGCLSAATYGLIPLFTLPVMAKGMDCDSILFYRYILATVSIGILLKVKGEKFKVDKSDLPTLLIMGALFAFSSLFLFMSYNHLAAGIASTILFLYPVFVTIIMAVFFHEKVSFITVLAIVLAFVGIGSLYKGDGSGTLSLWGITLVFLSSLSYALYIVGVNKSKIKHMSGTKLTFYALLTGTFFFFIKLRCGVDLEMVPDLVSWVNLLCLAILPTVVSCVAMVYAVHYIGSTSTAVLGAMEPVTAVCIGVLVFKEPFTLNVAIGFALIITAVTLIIMSGSIQQNLARMRRGLLVKYSKKK